MKNIALSIPNKTGNVILENPIDMIQPEPFSIMLTDYKKMAMIVLIKPNFANPFD